ncbi:MAG: VWA domain-containing protein [Pyrinomonadaceae bacterium]|nr:VWA domain-containing protein [Phycisphaerales bacterium]
MSTLPPMHPTPPRTGHPAARQQAGISPVASAANPSQGVPSMTSHRVVRWTVGGSLVGFLTSLGVHGILLLIAAYWIVGGTSGAPGESGSGGDIQMAIMSDTELSALEAAAGMDSVSPASAIEEGDAFTTPEVLEGPSGVPDVTGPTGLGGAAEGLGGAGGDIGEGDGMGDGIGGGSGNGTATFFGVEASGTRFAYVVDVSGSMQGPKLSALKMEIIESIDSLIEHMQFFVSPFSSDGMLLGNKDKWTPSTDVGKKWALQQVKDLQCYGGTNPLPSFQKVFDLKPRPDAIYFMTDGMFEPEVGGLVAKMNKRGKKVPIHCIAFDIQEKAVEDAMKAIAEESGGRYVAVPLSGSKK